MKLRTSDSSAITSCSATDTELEPVISTTSILCAHAAAKSTWSLPMPAVIASLRCGADAMRSAVRYAGESWIEQRCET